jgi:hypothetical protein
MYLYGYIDGQTEELNENPPWSVNGILLRLSVSSREFSQKAAPESVENLLKDTFYGMNLRV